MPSEEPSINADSPHLHDKCNGIKMYGSVVVGTKWQIVIPSEVRRELHIESGDTMLVVTKHGKAIALTKTDDLDEFMAYMQREINLLKQMKENH